MDFYMHHGRTDPDGAPQSLVRYKDESTDQGVRIEYIDIDDWGFEGPRLTGVIGFHCTYGVDGNWNLYFEDKRSADEAQHVTGWHRWDECALTARFSEDNSLLRIDDPEYSVPHYFGDWGIK